MLFLPLAVCSVLLQDPALVRPAAPKHLTMIATASPDTAPPGAKVSLFLDVTPHPRVHVYAPGAKDYLPISVAVDRQPGVMLRPAAYPAAQTMVFEGEKVPVYEQPFRVVQEATLARSLKPGATVTLTGSVKYQACDDQVCFIPETVPVTWTITIAAPPQHR